LFDLRVLRSFDERFYLRNVNGSYEASVQKTYLTGGNIMKSFSRKRAIFVLIFCGVFALFLPNVVQRTRAVNVSKDILQSASLVSGSKGADPFSATGWTTVTDGAAYDPDSDYYLKIQWAQSPNRKLIDGDYFQVEIEGLQIENTTTPALINISDGDNNNASLGTIGNVFTFNNKITVVFDPNLYNAPTWDDNDLSGTVYVKTSMDLNLQVGNQRLVSIWDPSDPDNTKTTYNLSINNILPTVKAEFRLISTMDPSNPGPWQVGKLQGLAHPGDTVEARVTFTPKPNAPLVIGGSDPLAGIVFEFNDYIMNFFQRSETPEDPKIDGKTVSNYTFDRISNLNNAVRPPEWADMTNSTYTAEKQAVKTKYKFSLPTTYDVDSSLVLEYAFNLDKATMDNTFQNVVINMPSVYVYSEFINNNASRIETASVVKKGVSETTSVTVRFVDSGNSQILETIHNNVPLDSKRYENYYPTLEESKQLQNKGYTFDFSIPFTQPLDKDASKNVVMVRVKKAATPSMKANIVVKFPFTDGQGRDRFARKDILIQDAPIDSEANLLKYLEDYFKSELPVIKDALKRDGFKLQNPDYPNATEKGAWPKATDLQKDPASGVINVRCEEEKTHTHTETPTAPPTPTNGPYPSGHATERSSATYTSSVRTSAVYPPTSVYYTNATYTMAPTTPSERTPEPTVRTSQTPYPTGGGVATPPTAEAPASLPPDKPNPVTEDSHFLSLLTRILVLGGVCGAAAYIVVKLRAKNH
jgi:hypothetical protein